MKTLRWLISVSVFSALMIGGYLWWLHSQRYPATSDAYIGAHVVRIAPQVGGKVAELPVTDHARVAMGQLLLAIDPESCQIAVKRAEANVALAHQAQADTARYKLREATAALV